MKAIKGLYLNSAIDDIPEGYTAFCRNGLINYKDGSITKEKGFSDMNLQLPYDLIGTIETADETFIFSTDNRNSAISRFKNEQLETIVDDKFKTYKFNFDKANPIKGTAIKNYKDQWVICWIDLINPIRILNTVNPIVNVEDDLLLFPQFVNPNLTYQIQEGGSIQKGTYIPFIRYSDLENTYTSFIPVGKPIYIGDKINKLVTSRQISITLTNLDTDYKFYELGFYYIKEGVIKAIVTDKRVVSTLSIFTLSSTSQFQDISPEELLISAPYYKQAQAITQYEDRLCLLGVEEYPELNLQTIANKIVIKCKSELINDIKITTTCKTTIGSNVSESIEFGAGNYKTFMHDEVYAFYLVGVLPNGRKTKAFTIPGRVAGLIEIFPSIVDNCYQRFQIENTCSYDEQKDEFSLGYWQNEDERYPDLPEFEELRGEKVRHHKFPSHQFCKQTKYKTTSNYGVDVLDRLGIVVSNVIIPNELKTSIIGYEIYYAKRTLDNQSVLGQSLILLSSVGTHQETQEIVETEYFKSTGGNFIVVWNGTSNDLGALNYKNLRLHSFDLGFFKPIISNLSLRHLGKLRTVITEKEYVQKDAEIVAASIDFTKLARTSFSLLPENQNYNSVLKYNYLPNNTFTTVNDNRTLESTLIVETKENIPINKDTLVRYKNGTIILPFVHESILTTVLSIKSNVYLNFYEQELVYTGKIHTGTSTEVLYCGDGFIGHYSFITYGLRESNDLNGVEGNRFIYNSIVESNANVNLRYEKEGDIYSKYYPQSDSKFIKDLDRTKEPNEIGYDTEFNRSYDISKMTPYHPYEDKDTVVKHSNRGILSAEEQREKSKRSWRTFFPLDYFEIKKTKGKIVEAYSFDRRILVKTEHSMFTNLDIQSLGNDEEIFLKSTNITEQTFQEIFDDEKGVIGTNHRFGSYLTPIGLVMIDQNSRNVYIYKGGLKKMNGSINTFLKDNLDVKEDNPFNANGYNISFDPQFNNIKLTQKGKKSFTISYNTDIDNWTTFHDYVPDAYIGQRSLLYSIKNNKIYKHNVGNYGQYYDRDIKPFYVDVPIRSDKPFVTNNVNWISQTDEEFKTFTHILVYNNYQCTGRIYLYQASWDNFNLKKLKGAFYFDYLRNELNVRQTNFLSPAYDFKTLDRTLVNNKEWFNKELFQSNVVVVRLEDDNLSNGDIALIQLGITPQQVTR